MMTRAYLDNDPYFYGTNKDMGDHKKRRRYKQKKVTQIDASRDKMQKYDQIQEVPLRSPNQGIRYGGRVVVGGRHMMIVAKGRKKDSMTPKEVLEGIYGKPIESVDIKFRD